MTPIIEVIVKPDGQTLVETRGFAGERCQQASRFLEQALGLRTGERLTAEFHQPNVVRESLRQGESG
jgi:hypothetical protein